MDEVNTQAVNQRAKVLKRVQLGLEAPPVVSGFPILHQRLCLSEGHTLRPILHRLFVGKSSSPQSSSKIGNGFLRNGNVKRTNFFGRVGYQRFKDF